MAAGKAKVDPFAHTRNKIVSLTAHAERVKSLMNSNTVPLKHEERAAAYKDWVKLEYSRTTRKLEELKLSLPAAK